MAISKKYLHIFHTVRSGDGTARLWPINETGIGTPIILRHQFKDLENHKNTTKDITCLEWNVSCALSFYPCFASLVIEPPKLAFHYLHSMHSDEGLTLKALALQLFTVANLHSQLSL